MIYYGNPASPACVDAMQTGLLGYIDTPAQGNLRPDGVDWCADNGAFSNNWNERDWWTWLQAHACDAPTCRFAAAPDVVADARRSHLRSAPWLQRIRALGYPVAYVAQNGHEMLAVPWHEFDALFLGGSPECVPCGYVYREARKPERDEPCPHCWRRLTEWKLGAAARALTAEAKARGKWVHMGRVNSRKRLRYADAIGCDSADGTLLTNGPDKHLPRLLAWLAELRGDLAMFAH